MTTATIIPACHGAATKLLKGQVIKVINTHGTQVVDTWAFTLSCSGEITTQMSMQHTRASLNSIRPKVGDGLYNNERKKMFTITEDTTKGVHDTLISACDSARYLELMGEEGRGHRSCADNLIEGLEALDIKPPQFTPSPLNLFMNIPVHDDLTTLSFEVPTSQPGEYISLKSEIDLLVAFSACPSEILNTNAGKSCDAHYEILD